MFHDNHLNWALLTTDNFLPPKTKVKSVSVLNQQLMITTAKTIASMAGSIWGLRLRRVLGNTACRIVAYEEFALFFVMAYIYSYSASDEHAL